MRRVISPHARSTRSSGLSFPCQKRKSSSSASAEDTIAISQSRPLRSRARARRIPRAIIAKVYKRARALRGWGSRLQQPRLFRHLAQPLLRVLEALAQPCGFGLELLVVRGFSSPSMISASSSHDSPRSMRRISTVWSSSDNCSRSSWKPILHVGALVRDRRSAHALDCDRQPREVRERLIAVVALLAPAVVARAAARQLVGPGPHAAAPFEARQRAPERLAPLLEDLAGGVGVAHVGDEKARATPRRSARRPASRRARSPWPRRPRGSAFRSDRVRRS